MDAETHEVGLEPARFTHDAQVAGEGQSEAGTDGRSLHRRHGGNGCLEHPGRLDVERTGAHRETAPIGRIGGIVRTEVGTGAERTPFGGDDRGTRPAGQCLQGVRHPPQDRCRQQVVRRPVQNDDGDVTVEGDRDGTVVITGGWL
jgi:hypothetical protein